MKQKIQQFFFMVIALLLLVGCSNADSQKIADLEAKVAALETKKLEILTLLNEYQTRNYRTSHKNGVFECANPYGGIQEVRFLASTVVLVTGMEENLPAYNNYYYYKFLDDTTLQLVDDIDMPDSLPYYTFENLQNIPDLLRTISFIEDGNTLTITPVNEFSTCTFRAD